jgi:hypothetical protein
MDVESAENPAFNGSDAPKSINDSDSSALQNVSDVESAVAATLAKQPSLEVAPATAPSAEMKLLWSADGERVTVGAWVIRVWLALLVLLQLMRKSRGTRVQ